MTSKPMTHKSNRTEAEMEIKMHDYARLARDYGEMGRADLEQKYDYFVAGAIQMREAIRYDARMQEAALPPEETEAKVLYTLTQALRDKRRAMLEIDTLNDMIQQTQGKQGLNPLRTKLRELQSEIRRELHRIDVAIGPILDNTIVPMTKEDVK